MRLHRFGVALEHPQRHAALEMGERAAGLDRQRRIERRHRLFGPPKVFEQHPAQRAQAGVVGVTAQTLLDRGQRARLVARLLPGQRAVDVGIHELGKPGDQPIEQGQRGLALARRCTCPCQGVGENVGDLRIAGPGGHGMAKRRYRLAAQPCAARRHSGQHLKLGVPGVAPRDRSQQRGCLGTAARPMQRLGLRHGGLICGGDRLCHAGLSNGFRA